MKQAMRLYGPQAVVASFNGGKDAVAVLHLTRAAVAWYNRQHGRQERMQAIYFADPREFEEVEELVHGSILSVS